MIVHVLALLVRIPPVRWMTDALGITCSCDLCHNRRYTVYRKGMMVYVKKPRAPSGKRTKMAAGKPEPDDFLYGEKRDDWLV